MCVSCGWGVGPWGHEAMGKLLHTGQEVQVQAGGDLDGLPGQRGRVEGERDRVYHFGVHQELRRLHAGS